MKLPAPLTTAALVLVLCLLVGCFLNACADMTSPIRACEYTAKPLSDSTAVVAYRELPCFDANVGRVVRAR